MVPPIFGFSNSFAVNPSGSTGMTNDVVSNIPIPNSNYGSSATSQNYMLPMPQGTSGYTAPATGTGVMPFLTGERRLVTLFVKTGQIVSNSIMNFNGNDTNAPFYDAQSGIKEPL